MHILRIAMIGLAFAAPGAVCAKEPARPKAEEPRRATGCEYLGPGYVKAPGSDTCIRLGGSMRVEGVITNK